MVQNQTEVQQSLTPEEGPYHFLRNSFQPVVPKLFDNPETITVMEVHTAIQKFLKRVKKNGLNTLPPNEKEQLFSEFNQLLEVTNLPTLIDNFKDVYCQYDPATCQRMSSSNPQHSLI